MKFSQWLSLIVLMVCLYVLWQIRNVLLLGLTAIVFAVVLNRGVQFLQHWIKSRKTAALIITATVLLTAGILGAIIAPPFIDQFQDLINLTPEIISQIRNVLSNLEEGLAAPFLQDIEGLDSLFNQLQSLDIQTLISRFFRFFSNTLAITLNVLLITVLTIMLLLNPLPYRRLFVRSFPASVRQRVWNVLDECEEAIAGWFLGILFNMSVIATLSMVGLWILGIPLAFVNGLLAGLLAFIPNIGPTISVIPPTAIALLGTPWKAIAVIALYILIQQLESNILTPMMMQKQVSLLPAVTLLSQVTFAVVFGFLGLLLALPLILIIERWLDEFWIKGFLDKH